MLDRLHPDFRSAMALGLYTGLTLLLAALVGMFEQFAKRPILEPLSALVGSPELPESQAALAAPIALDLVLLLGGLMMLGYMVARRSEPDRSGRRPLASALAGGTAGLVLGLYVQLADRVDLSDILINAKPLLINFLSFGAGATLGGLLASIVVGMVMSLIGAGLARLPEALRPGVIWGLATVVLLGTLQSILTRQVDLVTNSRRAEGPIAAIVDWVYANRGVSWTGALAVIGLALLWTLGKPRLDAALASRMADMPVAQRARTGRWLRGLRLALVLGLLLWLPLGLGTYPSDVMDTVGIYILMGLGLNIVVGFAGLLDLGYVAFYAIGAYTLAVLTSVTGDIQMGFWSALPIAVLASIAFGIVLGIPVLKTHGDYLAIITLGFGEIIRILAISDALKPWLGGARGIQLIPPALSIPRRDFPLVGTLDPQIQQEMYYPILVAVGLALYVGWRLLHSRFGRAWMAVREDEEVAEAMGINLVGTKLLAFATGASMAGLGGALFASKVQTIFPASFGLLISINILVLIIVGGMGSIPGVFIGALALVALPELLREFSDFRMLLYGMVLVIMMLNRPEGLWPTSIAKRELHREPRGEAAVAAGGGGR